jgi:hypothetical protein
MASCHTIDLSDRLGVLLLQVADLPNMTVKELQLELKSRNLHVAGEC